MTKKLTTEQFIQKAKSVHGDKYDYSLVEYVNTYTKVKIICKIHGVFEQAPKGHLKNNGCLKCGKINSSNKLKLTTDEFIKRSNIKHKNKYDYSLVEYININTNVKIICPIHGVFEQLPSVHTKGNGCTKCYNNGVKTTKDFINDCKNVHGDKYDYSSVKYINSYSKVDIICKEHGVFKQSPNHHISLKAGCPKCSSNYNYNTTEFIEKSKNVHGDRYDYSLVDYINSYSNVKIICKEHGMFEQTPRGHLRGNNCPYCGITGKLTTKQFIKNAKLVHGDKYDYSLVEYVNNRKKIKIVCSIHKVFEQTPHNHINGKTGCPKCNNSLGELKIEKYLQNKNIKYTTQKSFDNCKNIFCLKFDFFIPDYNICIEYDGEQHYMKYNFEKDNSGLKKRQKRDNIKTKYCKDNNIKLIRIPYTEYENVENFLEIQLNKFF